MATTKSTPSMSLAMIDLLRPFFDYALVILYLFWLALILPKFLMRYRRYQKELQGLVIPAAHMPPVKGQK